MESAVNRQVFAFPLRAWVAVAALSAAPPVFAQMLAGRAALPEHVATPAGAVLEVALVDLSALDEDEHLLGTQRIENPGATPMRFSVPYDRRRLLASHRYVVRAVLRVNGAPGYAGEEPLPGTPTHGVVHLALHAVDGAPAAPPVRSLPTLSGSEWRAVEIDGQPVNSANPAAVPALAFGDGERLQGVAGCNRLSGHYEAGEGTLRTDSLVTTRMACPPATMALETRFLAALAASASARVSGEQLEIRDAAGMLRLRLEVRHAH